MNGLATKCIDSIKQEKTFLLERNCPLPKIISFFPKEKSTSSSCHLKGGKGGLLFSMPVAVLKHDSKNGCRAACSL